MAEKAQGSSPDLFDFATRYPHAPGYRRNSETSKAASKVITKRAQSLQERILELLRLGGTLTPDECAALLGVSVLACRPRFSELARLGKIIPLAGQTRQNESGLRARVYRIAADWL
jgi:hypothetical protein